MRRRIGAEIENDICSVTVWAPKAERVELLLKDQNSVRLCKDSFGYWQISLQLEPAQLYKFRIDDQVLPDPASRSQPGGVHSWSEIVSDSYSWDDASWKGLQTSEMIIYELHTGTFSEEGTFEGILGMLDHFLELGINTLEIMPISQFSGKRNWGYDGVFPFAVQNSYGSRESLKDLINNCHQKGLAVLLDVVYNHLGPEGNYLPFFGPYFTDKYKTPWGSAINYDDKDSDEVRNYFLQNALMWLEEFHFDGLRLDAVHEIIDRGARHFLQELRETVDELEKKTGRQYILIAESDLNDARIVSPINRGGYGLQAQWVDDFHHAVHTFLTGENKGYYSDYGKLEHLAKTIRQGFVYDGQYSHFRKKTIGSSPIHCEPFNFLVSLQNHDQVGNRPLGERLSSLISFEALKLAAGILLISPYVPMLFMGEEFGEDQPFLYFVSHSAPDLIEAVRKGRKKEFEYFFESNAEDFPDPQSELTFNRSKLNWNFGSDPQKIYVFEFYKHLIHHRKQGKFTAFGNGSIAVKIHENDVLSISGSMDSSRLYAVCNFSQGTQFHELPLGMDWNILLSSTDSLFGGREEISQTVKSGKPEIHAESITIFESHIS